MIDLWYKSATVYSLDVETFYDGNGDGVGDFNGLTQKLDYLSGLNITCLWLLPFYPSPNRDNGYDITDYYGVDPRLGTLGDFVQFTHDAKERGLRILVDLVINHTSIDHPWFQIARKDPQSPYRDYYVWSKEKPADAHEGMVFPGEQESVWTFDEEAGEWYFHRFYKHQPDLNIANPAVREEISKIMGFWLQLGVSGFRVDALPFVIEHRGIDNAPDSDPHEYLKEFRHYLSWRRGDAVMLAEANLAPDETDEYFGNGDRVQVMFNFFVNQHMLLAFAREQTEPVRAAYAELPQLPGTCQWANFLRTHDELDLGRLSDEQRAEVFAAFAPDPHMQLYDRGIRRRLPPMFRDRRRLECANSLMLSLPGTPVLRYGDEIGMGDNLDLEERKSVRTPMQWNRERNAGFSTAPAEKLIHPVISEGEYSFEHVNVEEQQRDPESLLSWTERILRVRRSRTEIGWGKCEFIGTNDPAILAHRCTHQGRCFLAVHNLSARNVSAHLNLPQAGHLKDLLTHTRHDIPQDGSYTVDLGPYGYRWFQQEASDRDRAS